MLDKNNQKNPNFFCECSKCFILDYYLLLFIYFIYSTWVNKYDIYVG